MIDHQPFEDDPYDQDYWVALIEAACEAQETLSDEELDELEREIYYGGDRRRA